MYYSEEEESGEESPSSSNSALLPKSLLGGKAVGDTITLKVVKIYDDEVEVAPQESEEKPKAPMTAEEEIDQMAYGRPG